MYCCLTKFYRIKLFQIFSLLNMLSLSDEWETILLLLFESEAGRFCVFFVVIGKIFLPTFDFPLYLFQLYSLVQLVSIIYQEAMKGIILQTSPTTNQTSTTPAYGSILQPSGMERDDLRIYHSVLVVVFFFVIFTCFLLFIDICKKIIARLTKNITLKMLQSISYLLLPWLFFTIISIILEFFIYIFIVFNKKVGLQFSNTL